MSGAHPSVVIPLLLAVPLLYWRMRRLARSRPLNLRRLWVGPILFVLLAALALLGPQKGLHAAPVPQDWAIMAVVTLLGAAAGWHWGRVMAIEVHPGNGTPMVRGGQAAIPVLAALILLRTGLRYGAQMEAAAWHLNAVLIADASILFSVALFCVRNLEMYLRARRIMARTGTGGRN
jgi:hypothetical protein